MTTHSAVNSSQSRAGGTVAEWLLHWTRDREVAGLNPSFITFRVVCSVSCPSDKTCNKPKTEVLRKTPMAAESMSEGKVMWK